MRIYKTFEEFVAEDALKAGEESDIYVEPVTLDAGSTIKSAEILGAITAAKTEKEFKDYFYNEYGQDAFAEGEMDVLTKYYLDKETEDAEVEKEESGEEEEEAGDEGGGDDDLDLDI
tara:strand:- start:386 stop:736 length:351 start_codon:yes stop_codon:yes gene_type:complete